MIRLQREQRDSASSSSADPVLLAIEPERVGEVWPLAAPHLERAMKTTRKWNLECSKHDCEVSHAQLWVCWDREKKVVLGAGITDILNFDTGFRTARVIGLGGREYERWGHLIETVEEWARGEKCDAIEFVGRKGWGRLFPDYRPIEYVYSKELV